MPEFMGLLHEKYATPHVGLWIMVVVSGLIATIGVVGGVTALTGITLASNLGTFFLYALICALTTVAFIGDSSFNFIKHAVIPFFGLVTNIIMALAIFIIGIQSGGATAQSTYLALAITGGWLLVSVTYFIVSSIRKGQTLLPTASKETPEF